MDFSNPMRGSACAALLALCFGACSGADASRDLAASNVTGSDDAGSNPPGSTAGGSPGSDLTDQGDLTECASVSAEGDVERAPVDVIWVVDASGSMVDEQQRIQENLAMFATSFAAAGVNAHVVMITEDDIGSCTDLAGKPEYLYVSTDVDSSNALTVLLDEFPKYAAHLRPEAVKHFIVVSDDESEMSASEFTSRMETNLGSRFVLHAIASEDTGMSGGGFGGFGRGACTPAVCPDNVTGACAGRPGFGGGFGGFGDFCGAARPGRIYYELADQTGGEKISICAEDWGEVFKRLQTAVIATSALPCEFDLPPAPAGKELDPSLVRVDFSPSGAAARQFPRAAAEGSCGKNEAWHYDDPAKPTQIVLCPAACKAVAAGGGIKIILACTADQVQVI